MDDTAATCGEGNQQTTAKGAFCANDRTIDKEGQAQGFDPKRLMVGTSAFHSRK